MDGCVRVGACPPLPSLFPAECSFLCGSVLELFVGAGGLLDKYLGFVHFCVSSCCTGAAKDKRLSTTSVIDCAQSRLNETCVSTCTCTRVPRVVLQFPLNRSPASHD